MTAQVVLVRHAETALNKPGQERIRGWLDVPLDDHGVEQSKEIAANLARDWICCEVLCSSLTRALQTGKQVANALGADLVEAYELRPWNVGEYAGKPTAEVLPKMITLTETPSVVAPGGESFARFSTRFLSYLQHCLRRARDEDCTLVAVTHTRCLQLARAWVAAGARPSLTYSPEAMNDYAHEIPTAGRLVLRPTVSAAG